MSHPSPPKADIGRFLRHTRKSLDLSLRDAARSAGVGFTYLSEVERGERAPSDSWLRTYVEHLGALIAARETKDAA